MIPGTGCAIFLDDDTVEWVPVVAWVTVDFGGDQSDLKGYVIRNGALWIADDADDFCGYVSAFGADEKAYKRNLNACLKEAQRLRAAKAMEVAH